MRFARAKSNESFAMHMIVSISLMTAFLAAVFESPQKEITDNLGFFSTNSSQHGFFSPTE